MSQPDCSILDASAAIVLFATGEIERILAAWPRKIGIVEQTLAEVLYLRDRASLRDKTEVQRISFDPLIDSGAIAVFTLQTYSEHARFIRYSQLLDDGEAAAAAVASERGHELVIDERKAHAVFGETIALRWSLELVHHWALATLAEPELITSVVRGIRQKASYMPHRAHPHRDWWDAHAPEE